ncbi:MAG: hypothetical protein KBS70_00425, partial [Bacteroidales bacterium]|nr:hypothetical protein [Candidatus Colicola equi]
GRYILPKKSKFQSEFGGSVSPRQAGRNQLTEEGTSKGVPNIQRKKCGTPTEARLKFRSISVACNDLLSPT